MKRSPLSEHIEREAFARAVLLTEITSPHDQTYCRLNGRCRLHEALAASVERLTKDGRALTRDGIGGAP